MKEFELKYGCNPNQKPARIFMKDDRELPIKVLNGRPNGLKGGIWRAGTGSAMTYLTEAKNCPATADGRHAGSNFGTNFSPALEARPDGILSVVQSFSKYDMTEIINGGPLTLEIHDTVLRNDIGIKKTAALVKAFIDLGGHQLQLNSINRERLLMVDSASAQNSRMSQQKSLCRTR